MLNGACNPMLMVLCPISRLQRNNSLTSLGDSGSVARYDTLVVDPFESDVLSPYQRLQSEIETMTV